MTHYRIRQHVDNDRTFYYTVQWSPGWFPFWKSVRYDFGRGSVRRFDNVREARAHVDWMTAQEKPLPKPEVVWKS
jgi:hypothetical protein